MIWIIQLVFAQRDLKGQFGPLVVLPCKMDCGLSGMKEGRNLRRRTQTLQWQWQMHGDKFTVTGRETCTNHLCVKVKFVAADKIILSHAWSHPAACKWDGNYSRVISFGLNSRFSKCWRNSRSHQQFPCSPWSNSVNHTREKRSASRTLEWMKG